MNRPCSLSRRLATHSTGARPNRPPDQPGASNSCFSARDPRNPENTANIDRYWAVVPAARPVPDGSGPDNSANGWGIGKMGPTSRLQAARSGPPSPGSTRSGGRPSGHLHRLRRELSPGPECFKICSRANGPARRFCSRVPGFGKLLRSALV